MPSLHQKPTPPSPDKGGIALPLVYVDDAGPGIRRQRCGKGFAYRAPDGARLRDAQQLRRIEQLAIPPAYSRCVDLPAGERPSAGHRP